MVIFTFNTIKSYVLTIMSPYRCFQFQSKLEQFILVFLLFIFVTPFFSSEKPDFCCSQCVSQSFNIQKVVSKALIHTTMKNIGVQYLLRIVFVFA